MQAGNIGCNGIRCAVIINNIIRDGKACFTRGLRGQNIFRMVSRNVIARHGALQVRIAAFLFRYYPRRLLVDVAVGQVGKGQAMAAIDQAIGKRRLNVTLPEAEESRS
jgi:hypothetical protein